jgi:hypothetical protein
MGVLVPNNTEQDRQHTALIKEKSRPQTVFIRMRVIERLKVGKKAASPPRRARAERVIETLLQGIVRARFALIEIAGVASVDTQTADALLRAARAVRLLGAEVVLTGIRPELAQPLVALGTDRPKTAGQLNFRSYSGAQVGLVRALVLVSRLRPSFPVAVLVLDLRRSVRVLDPRDDTA